MIKMQRITGLIIFGLGLFITASFCAESFAEVNRDLKAQKELEEEDIIKKVKWLESTKEQDEIIRPKIEYNSQGLKDPFRPVVMEKKVEPVAVSEQPEVKPFPVLTVQGLVWGGNFPQAIINNKVVKMGDMLGEVKIIGISKEGVTVSFANREKQLPSPAVTGPEQKGKK